MWIIERALTLFGIDTDFCTEGQKKSKLRLMFDQRNESKEETNTRLKVKKTDKHKGMIYNK